MRRLVILLALVSGCFNIETPPCAYACGPQGQCPDEYVCGSDNYCHHNGTGVCLYPDAAVAEDLSEPSEGGIDLGSSD